MSSIPIPSSDTVNITMSEPSMIGSMVMVTVHDVLRDRAASRQESTALSTNCGGEEEVAEEERGKEDGFEERKGGRGNEYDVLELIKRK